MAAVTAYGEEKEKEIMIKQFTVFIFGILISLFLFNIYHPVYAETTYDPEKVDYEALYYQTYKEIHSPKDKLPYEEQKCADEAWVNDGLEEQELAMQEKYMPMCYRKTWVTKEVIGCAYSQPDLLEFAKKRVQDAVNKCKGKVKKTDSYPSETQGAPLTKEERYNECVRQCFLDKILSMCPDNNNMNQCTLDLINARKECLRTCKPPVQFQTPKASDQEKTITKQDYGNKEVLILNGLPITNNSSVNFPFVSYSPVIEKIDLTSAKTSKPSAQSTKQQTQESSEKNLEVWVAGMKGDAQVYIATGSSQPKWTRVKIGDILSEGVKIFVAKGAELLIGTDVGVLKITGLSDLTITKARIIDDKQITFYIDLNIGTIEVDVEKGQYELDIQINTLSSLAKVKGTHFFVSFDEKNLLTQTGVFEGEVEVESLVTGQKLALVPQSDSKPRIALVPLEVNASKPIQEPVSSVTQEEQAPQTSGSGLFPILILLAAGGLGLYILHKKGKLTPLYKQFREKISEKMKKNSRKTEEKET